MMNIDSDVNDELIDDEEDEGDTKLDCDAHLLLWAKLEVGGHTGSCSGTVIGDVILTPNRSLSHLSSRINQKHQFCS